MTTHKIYTNDEFLYKLSYLFPIASNYVNAKKISVPINTESTIATLKKFFAKENVNGDENYALNLWNNSPQIFCDKFFSHYWSDDPIIESQIDLHSLNFLSFPVKQYIGLSLINVKNDNSNSNFLIYDVNCVNFNNLDELIELFNYVSNMSKCDFTETVTNVLGNITNNIPAKTNQFIDDERTKNYKERDEKRELKRKQEELEIEQQMTKLGLKKPSLTQHEITIKLTTLSNQIHDILYKELHVLKKYVQQSENLYNDHKNKFTNNDTDMCSLYFTEIEKIKTTKDNEINALHTNLLLLRNDVTNIKCELENRNTYDKLVFKNLHETLNESFENLKYSFDSKIIENVNELSNNA